MNNEQHLTLALNCVESVIQVVLGTEAGLIFTAQWQGGGQGVEQLAPMLSTAFSHNGLNIKDLDRIAVVRGPGSFTGIRLGLATAAGLARSAKARNAGLLLHRCIAQGVAPLLPEAQLLAVLTHARSNLLYLQCFIVAAGEAQPLDEKTLGEQTFNEQTFDAKTPEETVGQTLPENIAEALPRVLSLEQALQTLQKLTSAASLRGADSLRQDPTLALTPPALIPPGLPPSPTPSLFPGLYLVGSGLLKHTDFFKRHLPEAALLPAAFNNPTPHALLELARQAEYSDEDLDPLYLRASDAEENLPHIAQTLGLDPKQAGRDLARLTSSDM